MSRFSDNTEFGEVSLNKLLEALFLPLETFYARQIILEIDKPFPDIKKLFEFLFPHTNAQIKRISTRFNAGKNYSIKFSVKN